MDSTDGMLGGQKMENKKWGLSVLTAIVVGNMIGGGIFMLPASLSHVASPMGTTFAWMLTGFGVFMIALVFGNLALRKPELKAGPQSYAQALFSSPMAGTVAGYSMTWGYWAANWSANASIIISFAGYLSTFFPVLQSREVLFAVGNFQLETGRALTFTICTAVLWAIHWILCRDFSSGGKISVLATTAKVAGFLLFILLLGGSLELAFAKDDFSFVRPGGETVPLLKQMNAAAVLMLWGFNGIESAVMLSNRARSQKDVKRATLLGLMITVFIYIFITLLTMKAVPLAQLQESQKPLVDALNRAIGGGGGMILALLALISLTGSIIGWIVVSAEVPYQAAKNGLFPSFFARTNAKGSPGRSMFWTNLLTQVFLFSTVSGTVGQAYNFAAIVATLSYLVPYFVTVLYQLKLVVTGETYQSRWISRTKDGIITFFALLYSLWVIKSGTDDWLTFVLGIGLFASGLILYPILMKNRGEEADKPEGEGRLPAKKTLPFQQFK